MRIEVESESFEHEGAIPRRHAYRGEGENVSPAIAWRGIPAGAREIALICDDPDAPRPEPWVHWVVFGIAPDVAGLPAGDARAAVAGTNTWDERGWGGPLPPEGHGRHRYRFRVYALDRRLGLEAGATKDELLSAMRGHVIGEGELVGTYERSR